MRGSYQCEVSLFLRLFAKRLQFLKGFLYKIHTSKLIGAEGARLLRISGTGETPQASEATAKRKAIEIIPTHIATMSAKTAFFKQVIK